MLRLVDPAGLGTRLEASVLRSLRSLKTLQDTVQAGLSVDDVVVQDEFTHDVVIHVQDNVYAAFDST